MPHELTSNDWVLDRRDFLRRCGMGMGGLALAPMLAQRVGAEETHFAPKAKRVVHLFMNGGPSQVDTFDRKTALDEWHGKTLPLDSIATERPTGAALRSPFKFDRYGKSGLEVSELFSETAKHADDLCVIRSMQADVPNHEPSLMLMNCGDGRLPRPSMGSWVSYGLGSENENLPAYVSMCPGGMPIKRTENWRSSFLPGNFQGTYLDTSIEDVREMIENLDHPVARPERRQKQLDLLRQINRRHLVSSGHDPLLEARIRSFELAYRMQSEATDAFDVSREPEPVREMYGGGHFARQCLMARRLLERGVRFIQLWHGNGQPWDSHDDIEDHRRLAGECDRAIGAFLSDLKMRGLLDETLVIWGGEFGRTPVVELPKAGSNKGIMKGRDHNHYGFTMWMAGGGVKGGHVHGATDEFGFKAVEKPVHVHDLHATVLHLLGFDHEQLTYRYSGRDFRLTDVHGRVVHDLIA
ncbi:sulfatase [Haloferula helveola]|uniref:Sulfatase n=1 Tax=Haloferula helveola TaxID=490095 RepID=A0ABM7RF68_9BACT|nr:sulfatase [Haloferula helveola]